MQDHLARHPSDRSSRRFVGGGGTRRSGTLLAIVAACSVALLAFGLRPAVIGANSPNEHDPDRDGLVSEQEIVLGTDPFLSDTDGDGYSDAEELARKSSPIDVASTPGAKDLDIGMTLRGQDGLLYLVVAVYAKEGGFQGATLGFGVLAGDRLVGISPGTLLAGCRTTVLPGSAPGSRLAILEVPLNPTPVHALGALTFFATVGRAQSGTVLAADARTLFSEDGLVYLLGAYDPAGASQMFQGPGSVYLPIPPGGAGDIPVTATPGQICFQSTQVVGVVGPVVVQEVVAADCLDDWDAYCRPDCAATVGDTFRAVDPTILVGL